MPWLVSMSYDELFDLKLADVVKEKELSWITSNKSSYSGHGLRLDFLSFMREADVAFDLYGRGFNPIELKQDALLPYKYSIAIENTSVDDYWTEKIIDCFLTYTMPIYYGAKNIDAFFPKESYLWVDVAKPQESIDKIKGAMADGLWEKNLDAIIEARNLVLNEYQFFPYCTKLIQEASSILNREHGLYSFPATRRPGAGVTNSFVSKFFSFFRKDKRT